jgi:integrase
VLDYRNAISASGKTARTANLSVKVVSAAFNAAVRQHIIESNPATALESLPVKAEEKGTFTRAQVAKLVRAADGDWRGAILLGYYTGARLSDVANMRWRAIDWNSRIVRFTASKTKKAVTLPLHPQLERELLKTAGIGNAPMFPSLEGKGTGGKHGLSGQFAAVMEKADIQGKRTQASGGRRLSSLSFHSLRHSFNSALANAGVSQEIRQKLTGHTSAEMNTIYTHHDLAPLRAAVEKLPSLGIK